MNNFNNSIIRRPFVYRYYNAVLVLIGINILVFFLTQVDRSLLGVFALRPATIMGLSSYWQFITYMFTHMNITHILFNLLGLFLFGTQVERRVGSSEFLLFYMLSGIGAGLISFAIYMATGAYGAVLLGSSGAVFAVLLAYAVYFPNSRIFIMGLIPVKAPYLVIGYTVIEIASQLFSINTGVAHLTHLAGFGIAFVYFIVRMGINPINIFRRNSRGNRY